MIYAIIFYWMVSTLYDIRHDDSKQIKKFHQKLVIGCFFGWIMFPVHVMEKITK